MAELKRMPVFDREHIQVYIDGLLEWQLGTEVPKQQQGLLVWISIPKDVRSTIKQKVSDCIGMEGLKKQDGLARLINLLKVEFQESEGMGMGARKKVSKESTGGQPTIGGAVGNMTKKPIKKQGSCGTGM